MVGGETVLFDVDLNIKTKKPEATRVKLAPLNANLKNEKNKTLDGVQRRKSRNLKDKHLPLISCPPSTFSQEKFTKCGMLGKIMSLPTKNRDGVIKFYVESHYTRADFKSSTTKSQLRIGADVQFDLNVWFDTASPFEAVNVELADKNQVIGRYSLIGFICDGLPDGKLWGLEDFKHLLLVLRQNGTQAYDWKSMSQNLKRTQGDIKNFLHIFVMELKKSSDPHSTGTYNKQQLDKFVNSINQVRTRHPECNNENVPLSDRRRSRSSSAKDKSGSNGHNKSPGNGSTKKLPAKAKPPSPKTYTELKSNKRPKLATAPPVPMVDSISQSDSLTAQQLTQSSPHLAPHQSFVAKNLQSWSQVPEVPGDRAVNSVLGDVFSSCAEFTSQPMSTGESSAGAAPDLGAVYRYIGALLAGGDRSQDIPVKLNAMESKIVIYLLQDLFDDMSKRNLFSHKQFLLQRFFAFTGNKPSGRTPINPFKLKGFLLHLPEPQNQRNSD